jgi:hypothetical protein
LLTIAHLLVRESRRGGQDVSNAQLNGAARAR